MKKCIRCGAEVGDNNKFCPECGYSFINANNQTQFNNNPQNNVNQGTMAVEPTHQKSWFVILMLILFFPVGIALMWIYKKEWNIVVKVLITGLCAFALIGAFLDGGSSQSSGTVENSTAITELSTETVIESSAEEIILESPEVQTELTTSEPTEELTEPATEKTEEEIDEIFDEAISKLGEYFDDEKLLDGEYQTLISFDYEANMLFAKETIDIYIDDIKCYSVLNGKKNANIYKLDEGKHTVEVTNGGWFHSDEEEIYVKGDGEIFCFVIENGVSDINLSLVSSSEYIDNINIDELNIE